MAVTRSPTSGRSRAATRWRESPSGMWSDSEGCRSRRPPTHTPRRIRSVVYDSSRNRPMTAPLLNIAALSRRTGVAPDTLRKWEQRYGVLRPVRTEGGQRRYDETDVAARRVAPRPDPRGLADRRGRPRDRRGRLGSARRARGAPRRADRVGPGQRPGGALGHPRPGVRRAAARPGADRRRHPRPALDRRGVAPRRALGRTGARDHRARCARTSAS